MTAEKVHRSQIKAEMAVVKQWLLTCNPVTRKRLDCLILLLLLLLPLLLLQLMRRLLLLQHVTQIGIGELTYGIGRRILWIV